MVERWSPRSGNYTHRRGPGRPRTVDAVARGLVTHYVLFVLDLATVCRLIRWKSLSGHRRAIEAAVVGGRKGRSGADECQRSSHGGVEVALLGRPNYVDATQCPPELDTCRQYHLGFFLSVRRNERPRFPGGRRQPDAPAPLTIARHSLQHSPLSIKESMGESKPVRRTSSYRAGASPFHRTESYESERRITRPDIHRPRRSHQARNSGTSQLGGSARNRDCRTIFYLIELRFEAHSPP